MKTCSVSTVINAKPHQIWPLLADASRWAEWDPSLDKLEGEFCPGGTVKLYSKISGRSVPVRISHMAEPTHMTWQGGMPLGLLKDERRVTLHPDAWGATEIRVEEDVTGPMSGMLHVSETSLTHALERFAAGLKRAAEAA